MFIDKPKADGYFKQAIRKVGCREFKSIYSTGDSITGQVPEVRDFSRTIMFEKLDEAIRHLDEFERRLMEVHLRGQNMTALSKETGIPISTIYHTLNKAKQEIKQRIK